MIDKTDWFVCALILTLFIVAGIAGCLAFLSSRHRFDYLKEDGAPLTPKPESEWTPEDRKLVELSYAFIRNPPPKKEGPSTFERIGDELVVTNATFWCKDFSAPPNPVI